MMQTIVILSNQIDVLIEAISEQVFTKIAKRKIVVPDEKLKTYFFHRLAIASSQKIAMGIEVVTLGQLLKGQDKRLSLFLEYLICIRKEEELFASLKKYLERSKMPIHAFCDELAKTFLNYALYGEKKLEEWLKKKGWQQELWKQCDFGVLALSDEFEWHVLGFNHMPSCYVDCFKAKNAFFYLLSPCEEFWEDLCTDKERVLLRKKLSIRQQEDLEEFLQDQNLLLANMGKLGRNFLRQFQDVEIEERYIESASRSTLEAVQSCILTLAPFERGKEDESIAIYPAKSLLQEIEILYAVLHRLMTQENIEPCDVQVFAPDINEYAPLIHMVFGKESGSIPYSMRDLNLCAERSFTKGFLELLKLPQERFSKNAVVHILLNQAFREKFSLSESDIEKISDWFDKTCIRWGFDANQRDLFLGEKMLEESEVGTWKESIKKLLLGFAKLAPTLPFVTTSEAELLEKLIKIIEGFNEDLQPLIFNQAYSIKFWQDFLNQLAHRYFVLQEEDIKLLKELDGIFFNTRTLDAPVFPFSTILSIVENLFISTRGKYQISHLQSVQFSSFPSGAPVPKKVTWVLGLHEEAFPRLEKGKPLSEITMKAPSNHEKDRYLFLELLISTQKYFCISYRYLSSKDHKSQPVSPVVQELFSFVQKPLPQPSNFPEIHLVRKDPYPRFLKSFYEKTKIERSSLEGEKIIDIKQLEKCAKHPLKLFFHEKLNLYLEQSEAIDEEFIVPAFTKAKMRDLILKTDFKTAEKLYMDEGKLPLGRFKEIAFLKIQDEIADGKDLTFGKTFSLNLNKIPFGIDVDGRKVCIKGVLENVSETGLVFYGEKNIKDLLRIWPTYLVYLNLQPQEFQKELFLYKLGKKLSPPLQNPQELLADYLRYYELCLEFPSPLMPEWGKALLEEDAEEFAKKIQEKRGKFFIDEYLKWLEMRDGPPNSFQIFENWSEILRKYFSSFLEWRKSVV